MQSNRLISFSYDSTAGVVKAVVQPSMKKGLIVLGYGKSHVYRCAYTDLIL